MPIVIDYTRMFPVFDRQAVESYRKKIAGLHAGLVERRRGGELPFYDLPSQDVSDILRFAVSGRSASTTSWYWESAAQRSD
jgi:hypothetical protein